MDTNKDLNTLLPGVDVTVAGETISIQPFLFIKLPKAIALIGKLGNLVFDVIKSINVSKADLANLQPVELIVFAAEQGIVIPEESKDDADAIRQIIEASMPADAKEGGIGISMQGNKIGMEAGTFEAITQLFEHGGDSLFELIKLGANQDQAWLEKLNSAEGFDVILAIIEVNMDFFKKRLSPILGSRMNKILTNL